MPLFTFFRHRNARDQSFILSVEQFKKGEPRPSRPSPKLSVIKRLVAEGRKGIVIPEDIDVEA